MSEGAGYGTSGTPTQTTNESTQTPQAPETQAPEIVQPGQITVVPQTGPVPEQEINTEQNAHDVAQETKGLVYKKVATSIFCFDCGRRAEYFATYYGRWEKYLCALDMEKELKKAETEGAQSGAGSTQPPPQTPPAQNPPPAA